MRSWSSRIKLLLIPTAAVFALAVMLWTLDLSSGARLALGLSAVISCLALFAGVWAIALNFTRRVEKLRDVLSHLEGGGTEASSDDDEMESLSKSLHKAVYRGKERETQLRRSSEFLEFAQTAGGFGIFDLDLVTAQLSCTPVFFELIGLPYRRLAFTRQEWLATVHPEDFESVARELSTAISAGGHFQSEYRSLLLDGGIRWLAARGEVLRDAEGLPARVIGTITDISQRKELEDTLRHTTESLNIAQSAAGVATMDLNFARRSWVCSDNFYEMLGIESSTRLDDLDARLARVHPDDVDAHPAGPRRGGQRRPRLSL